MKVFVRGEGGGGVCEREHVCGCICDCVCDWVCEAVCEGVREGVY